MASERVMHQIMAIKTIQLPISILCRSFIDRLKYCLIKYNFYCPLSKEQKLVPLCFLVSICPPCMQILVIIITQGNSGGYQLSTAKTQM